MPEPTPDTATQTELEAAAFRRLVEHLRERTDVQNIDLMNLAGFCRNCLSRWVHWREAGRVERPWASATRRRGRSFTACRTRNGRPNIRKKRARSRRPRWRSRIRVIDPAQVGRYPRPLSRWGGGLWRSRSTARS